MRSINALNWAVPACQHLVSRRLNGINKEKWSSFHLQNGCRRADGSFLLYGSPRHTCIARICTMLDHSRSCSTTHCSGSRKWSKRAFRQTSCTTGSQLRLDGMTKFGLAVATDQFGTVQRMLEQGDPAVDLDAFGCLPLHYTRSPRVLNLLLNGMPSSAIRKAATVRSTEGLTVFESITLLCGNLEEAQQMDMLETIVMKCCANDVDRVAMKKGTTVLADRLTMLHDAALHKNALLLKVLLKSNADTNARDQENSTPLHYAVRPRPAVPARIRLLARGKSKRSSNWASDPRNIGANIVKDLVEAGADYRAAAGTFGNTPVHEAILCNNFPCIGALVEASDGKAAQCRNFLGQLPADLAKKSLENSTNLLTSLKFSAPTL